MDWESCTLFKKNLKRFMTYLDSFKQSIEHNKKGIILMVISSLCVCLGQLMWKLGADYQFLLLLIGFFFYGIGAIFMVWAYKNGSLSVLQPLLSLNCLFSFIIGWSVLHESLSPINIIGVFVIMLGVVLISGGD